MVHLPVRSVGPPRGSFPAAILFSYYEGQRRQRLWAHLSEARRQWIEGKPVLVEMSNAQIRRIERDDFEGLPEGVELPWLYTGASFGPRGGASKIDGAGPGD
jgi:hypothetical protein